MKILINRIKEFKDKKKKTESCYKYYVHYQNFDRRMDEWVLFTRIKLVKIFHQFFRKDT